MPSPAALLFDLDGTLVDSAQTIALALSELSRRRGGGPADVGAVRGLVSRGAAALVRQTLGPLSGDSDEDVTAFRTVLAEIPAHPGMIYPDVVEALEDLVGTGHACAIVTNKPEALARLLLDQLGLARYFSSVVGGDTLPVCKPQPLPLRHALQAMPSASPRLSFMIGDSDVDSRAAAAAGLPFLLFLGGYEGDRVPSHACAGSFANFADLPMLVRQRADTPAQD